MMPERYASYSFLRDILRKHKKVFTMSEVRRPALPKIPGLETGDLIKAALKCPTTLQYLPDPDELKPKRVSRIYIATIIHTLDPAFI